MIQRNVTWNIIHIYLIHEKKDLIRGMAAKSSNEILPINHCYICNMVFVLQVNRESPFMESYETIPISHQSKNQNFISKRYTIFSLKQILFGYHKLMLTEILIRILEGII